MPTSVIFNGERVYRPGVYIRVIDAIPRATSLSAGNIALIGDFPYIKQGEPLTFSTSESFREYFTPNDVQTFGDAPLALIRAMGRVAFDQLLFESSQPIDSLTMINVQPCSPATYENDGLGIRSLLYGEVGNTLRVELETVGQTYTIRVKQGQTDLADPMVNIGDIDFASILFENLGDADDLDDATIEVSESTALNSSGAAATVAEVLDNNIERTGGKIIVRGYKEFSAATINALPTSTLYTIDNGFGGGAVSVAPLAASPSRSETITVNGFGYDGAELTQTILVPSGAAIGTYLSTSGEFKYITNVQIADAVAASCGFTLKFPIKSDDLTNVMSVGAFLEAIAAIDGRFVADRPPFPITADQLDQLDETTILDTTVSLKTHLYRIWERAFNASPFIRSALLTNVLPADFDEQLSGGGIGGAADDTDWTDALDGILYENINIVVPWTTTFAFHALVSSHCNAAAKNVGLERCAWIATPRNTSIDNTFQQYVKKINNRNVAIVNQVLNIKNAIPEAGQSDTRWTALALAVMQASTPISEPLTHKSFTAAVEGTFQNFDPNRSASEGIRKGVVLITSNGNRGFWVERSITSYQTNPEHPVYTEVSANESVNVSLRDLRAYLKLVVGSKASLSVLNDVKRLVNDRLTLQRQREIIANFRNVKVSLSGDIINVSYELAAQEPLNFILVSATLGQF